MTVCKHKGELKMTKLPYKVECKSSYPFFETIAAFDVEQAAKGYASECSLVNNSFTYRVSKGKKVLFEIAPKYLVCA